MKLLRTICLWIVAAVILTSGAPEAFASWRCEGRTCSPAGLLCCCVSARNSQDSRCRDEIQSSGSKVGSRVCGTGCRCEMTLRSTDARTASSVRMDVTPPAYAALVECALPVVLVAPADSGSFSYLQRGPPAGGITPSPQTRRGPPSLTPPPYSI